ncbi:carboxypeptidase-like regulatory domain-containing protein [Hymenobacter caeli]|uniref:Carboxypeptidase-like regulatory domain-containing protein n=1 Tax=Hymenobacter caeli TaxID=2735894 RepID=A0ABX2FUB6_9BACT|nr:carboxypeptidase-like regulatory domain-containing protein [Hymenobacter caeli]NRT19924.1 hypothetical protein [Hymenobacter caeli]
MTLRFFGCTRRGWPWVLALLAGLALPARAQQVRVSGTIAAFDSREPIPGATVRVQRTRRGLAAGLKGEFEIDVLNTDTLLFRAVGFKPRQLPLGGMGLSQLVIQVQLQRDSVRLGEVRVNGDRPDRAMINRALRNMKRPVPPVVSGAKRPPKPKPLFPVDSSAPKAPVPTLESPVSLLYEQFSREGKQRRKVKELEAADKAEKERQARAKYNKAFKDNRGYEP